MNRSATEALLARAPELSDLLATADHVDVKTVIAPGTLQAFVCALLGWQPHGTRWLFEARAVLARVLRLEHPRVPMTPVPESGSLALVPGTVVAFFTVRDAVDDRYVVLEAVDNHLSAYLAVVASPTTGGPRRFDVVTVVRYHRWAGPVYFNLIRPFHHLVVAGMARTAARRLAAAGST